MSHPVFTNRHREYRRFIRLFRYEQGLRAFFLRTPILGNAGERRILDAGCGTGAVTFALREALNRRGLRAAAHHAFDVTPAMLTEFRRALRARGVPDVEPREADVLELETLPASWRDYDLIVTASMFEYLPPAQVAAALRGLRARLRNDGWLILFATKRNPLMQLLVGRMWQARLFTSDQLRTAFGQAGFSHVRADSFPFAGKHLTLWGHIVVARR